MIPATTEQEHIVREGLAAWGDRVADRVLKGRRLWTDGDVVRLAAPAGPPAGLEDLVGGLPIGRFKEGLFQIGLQGAVLVAPHAQHGIVKAEGKGAEAWLYGRPLLVDSVHSWDRGLSPGDPCIVTNVRGEALGTGIVVGTFKGRGEVVRPVHELGAYLRDEDA